MKSDVSGHTGKTAREKRDGGGCGSRTIAAYGIGRAGDGGCVWLQLLARASAWVCIALGCFTVVTGEWALVPA